MRFTPLALVLVAGSAVAEPAPSSQACAVTILRAPDDVRAVIEKWIAAEPRCGVALEVRVVPTDGGYYLIARDAQGRTYDRVAPDAQTAGVLVASWAAEEVPVSPFAMRTPGAAPVDPKPNDPALASEGLNPPGTVPTITAPAAPVRGPARWLSAGPMFGVQDGGGSGFRAELDLKLWTRWSLGITAAYARSRMEFFEGALETSDTKGLVYLSRTAQLGHWQLRGALGLGMVYARPDVYEWDVVDRMVAPHDGQAFLTGETSLTVARELGDSWAVTAGPLVSLYAHSYTMLATDPLEGMKVITADRREIDVSVYIGIRHRL